MTDTLETPETLETVQADIRHHLTGQEPPMIDHVTRTDALMPTYQMWTMTEAAELLDHVDTALLARMSDRDLQKLCADRVAEIVRDQLTFSRRRDILIASIGAPTITDTPPPSLLDDAHHPDDGYQIMDRVTGDHD